METNVVEISVKGKILKVSATIVESLKIVVNGGWLRMAEIHDEPWQLHGVEDPASLVAKLKGQSLQAEILTFSQKLPDTKPRFPYQFVWDNVAAIPITNYTDWWEKRLPQETRKNVRRAAKRGVVVRSVDLDDGLVHGIKGLYDESPMRQGRRFWHYGKGLQAIKQENSSYLERCEFIGAFYEGELIGFLKMVYIGNAGRIMQILSKNSHFDKRPTNALLAKAVEICADKGMSYFIYGQYVYGNNHETAIIEFKRRNGFEQISFPKYYVPLTAKGSVAMSLKLHLGFRRLLPRKLENALLSLRMKYCEKTLLQQIQPATEAAVS
jgi:hypothetical protein